LLLDLDPYLLQWGFLSIRWYGFFMAIAVLVGSIYFYREGLKQNLDEDFLLNTIILVVVAGVVGARLMFVLANHPQWFIEAPLEVFKVWEGGLAWHGGLLGGFLAGYIYCKRKGISPHRLADLTVPGLALGYALVRIGNIFNGEVLGNFTAFGWRWPAQLVGFGIGIILLIRFFVLRSKNLPAGYQFWSFVFYHQILRAVFEESVRVMPHFLIDYIHPTLGLGFVTLAQWLTPPLLLIFYFMMQQSKRHLLE